MLGNLLQAAVNETQVSHSLIDLLVINSQHFNNIFKPEGEMNDEFFQKKKLKPEA